MKYDIVYSYLPLQICAAVSALVCICAWVLVIFISAWFYSFQAIIMLYLG